MKWKKQLLVVGLIGVALGTFFKILRQSHLAARTPIIQPTQSVSSPTPLVDETHQSNTVASVPERKNWIRSSFSQIQKFLLSTLKKVRTITSTLFNIVVVFTLYVIVLALVVPRITDLTTNFKDYSVPKEYASTQSLSSSQSDLFPSHSLFQPPLNSPTLSFAFNKIKYETSTTAMLNGTLYLDVPLYFFLQICDNNAQATGSDKQICDKGSPVAYETKDNNVTLKPQYKSASLVLHMNSWVDFSQFSRTISFGQLFDSKSLIPSVVMPISLSTVNATEAYPDDWYSSRSAVYINLFPSSLYVSLQSYVSQSSHKDFQLLPMDVNATLDPALKNMSVSFGPSDESPDYQNWLLWVDILVQRNLDYRLLIYLTAALIPFGLILLVAHALFVRKQKNEEALYNVTLNILVVMLTVVAIRQIFVPSDIQGTLTRLDLILFTEGVILLGLIFIRYANSIITNWRHPQE